MQFTKQDCPPVSVDQHKRWPHPDRPFPVTAHKSLCLFCAAVITSVTCAGQTYSRKCLGSHCDVPFLNEDYCCGNLCSCFCVPKHLVQTSYFRGHFQETVASVCYVCPDTRNRMILIRWNINSNCECLFSLKYQMIWMCQFITITF